VVEKADCRGALAAKMTLSLRQASPYYSRMSDDQIPGGNVPTAPKRKSSNLPIFTAIAIVATACGGGLYYLFSKASGLYNQMPDYASISCKDLQDMPKSEAILVTTRLAFYYQLNGGDISTDEKSDLFVAKITETCLTNEDQPLQAAVDQLLAEQK
jgi:hypothetical protein